MLVERVARRLGPGGLIRALSGDRVAVLAALKAAPLTDHPHLLLPALVGIMRQPERALATQAARAARAIAETLRLPDLDLSEEVPSLMVQIFGEVRSVVGDTRVSLDIRVQALLTLAQLVDVVPHRVRKSLLGFLTDTEPRIREAAVELFASGATAPELTRLSRLVAADPSSEVARAAAVALCAQVGGQQRDLALSALRGARAFPRLREMLESLDALDDQLVDLSRCLVFDAAPRDRQRTLKQLGRRSARLRRLLRRQRR